MEMGSSFRSRMHCCGCCQQQKRTEELPKHIEFSDSLHRKLKTLCKRLCTCEHSCEAPGFWALLSLMGIPTSLP
eukprot:scaffold148015_cov21-Tisochrysis_lutea.AAC.1